MEKVQHLDKKYLSTLSPVDRIDVICDHLFVHEQSGMVNLAKEGVADEKISFVGNVMIDSLIYYREKAKQAWQKALSFIQNADFKLVLLDEVNVALKLGYLDLGTVLAGIDQKPQDSHLVLTGRGAPAALIERADLVTEMTLIKHPFREQGVKAQPGIEY